MQSFVVSYTFSGLISNSGPWRLFVRTGMFKLPRDDAAGRHVAMRLREAVVQWAGTEEVAILNFWPVAEE